MLFLVTGTTALKILQPIFHSWKNSIAQLRARQLFFPLQTANVRDLIATSPPSWPCVSCAFNPVSSLPSVTSWSPSVLHSSKQGSGLARKEQRRKKWMGKRNALNFKRGGIFRCGYWAIKSGEGKITQQGHCNYNAWWSSLKLSTLLWCLTILASF